MKTFKEAVESHAALKTIPTASAVLEDGSIVEMVVDPAVERTRFAIWKNGDRRFEERIKTDALCELVPYSRFNNLVRHKVILFPSEPEEYESEEQLIQEIRTFIHRYVDVSPGFEEVASYYVLFSWIHDGFNELPYLRVRGDFGSGKTRFLLTVGSLCYKPMFASGASTVSPIFRILESFRGTLVIDESDFRFSDEKAEVTKILNNGNAKGIPLLRSEATTKGEFNPHAYHVFGPKIVATRGSFDDKALESRFLTEDLSHIRLRTDIPINLPPEHKIEALRLRNNLLMFRFRNFNRHPVNDALVDRTIEPRLNQIFVPLLSVISDRNVRDRLKTLAREYNKDLANDRGLGAEGQLLQVIDGLRRIPDTTTLPISEVVQRFGELHGDEYDKKITSRWIGYLIRDRLHLKTHKSHGNYVIPREELPKLDRLCERYGLTPSKPADGAPG